MTRREGRLVEWFPDRGFGFIAPDDGGPNVFLHIKSLPKEDKRLDIGQAYSF
ncbi:MAG: cold shock domain-containing protein, partial [Pseudomonadota bacterium]